MTKEAREPTEQEHQLSDAIMRMLCRRRVFRHAWDACDDEIRAEIFADVARAAISAMPSPLPLGTLPDGRKIEKCSDVSLPCQLRVMADHARWQGNEIDRLEKAIAAMPSGWRPIAEAKRGVKYVVGYPNSLGEGDRRN